MSILIAVSLIFTGCGADSEEPTTEEPESNTKTDFIDGKVVTINDHTFDESDLEFYTLMNKVKIILMKEAAEKNDDDLTYYDEQLKYYDFVNANLQELIELYSMSLLAKEKNYFIPDDQLVEEKEKFNAQIEESKEATSLIEEFGEDTYKQKIDEYIRQVLLRDRIAQDLEQEVIDENPDASEEEINYLTENKYDDLYMAQMETLEVEVHVH